MKNKKQIFEDIEDFIQSDPTQLQISYHNGKTISQPRLNKLIETYGFKKVDATWECIIWYSHGSDGRLNLLVIQQHPDIYAVLLTSPSYEGVFADYKKIREVIGSRYLIVDEAHGAINYFNKSDKRTALSAGADITVSSMHKSLGSLVAASFKCSSQFQISYQKNS
ncbi:hypothetical protein ABPG72_014792 [Tetrahymena utriculariae]